MKYTLVGPVYEKHELKFMLFEHLNNILLDAKSGYRDAITPNEWEILGDLMQDAEVQDMIAKKHGEAMSDA